VKGCGKIENGGRQGHLQIRMVAEGVQCQIEREKSTWWWKWTKRLESF
jgi:hypothetical protein